MLISKFETSGIEQKIKMFEAKYDIQLPQEYRKFVLKYNGGITLETIFRSNRISLDIVGFYGFGNVDIEYNFIQFDKIDILPQYLEHGVIPIAFNDFGDKIGIGIREDNYDKIYFIYHDMGKIVELTKGFADFIYKCKSKRIGKILSIEERKQIMIKNGLEDKISEESIRGWQAEIDEYEKIHQEEVIL